MTRSFRASCVTLVAICGVLTSNVEPARAAGCEDFVPPSCTRIKAGDRIDAVVKDKCYVLDENSTGANTYEKINVLSGGKILFVDPGFDSGQQKARTIQFKVSALLIEKGGVVQAGSPSCPFGKEGGQLAIGLYGKDATKQGTVNPPPAADKGIQCQTNPGAGDGLTCFPDGSYKSGHYCTVAASDDPCSGGSGSNNELLEPYGNLPFDDNPWGYKTIGVAYGGTLALYGYKGARPLQDKAWGQKNDPDDHCPVPNVSKLDTAEMKEWANLSGNSWGRLADQVDDSKKQITTLTLDRNVAVGNVADWKVGDWIVVGATDWYPNHSELRAINKITPLTNGTEIEIDILKFPHSTKIFDAGLQTDFTNPVARTTVDTRAVVGLLSRSIQIYALGNTAGEDFPKTLQCTADKTSNPDCYFGGHVIARQGFRQVALQGVEFKWLGQGGRMGHYPVHFHMAKSTSYTRNKDAPAGTFVKDSSVWDSMTRFIVVHGTHDVTLARNVGYLSLGHGYYLEDASEINNRLCFNLGVGARAALQQYVTEQQKMEHWCGGEPPPAARVVPPILDGTIQNRSQSVPESPTGSDSYMPVMYWIMNAYNELVGNAAVSVHGFGSCFWLLGSGVSGASLDSKFDGFASYNTPSRQAPLLRFRGNTCSTSPYALPSTREVKPGGSFQEARLTGFTALANPYLTNGAKTTGFRRPIVAGSYQPMLNGQAMTCAPSSSDPGILGNNTKTCVMTVIDRFATSYNWAEVNFASVWLRPWYYLFANGALTDQLFGGLGFVTGGDWQQAPPAYMALAQNNLFVGTTQPDGPTNLYARRSGPRFVVSSTENLQRYSLCKAGEITCNVAAAGTGYWRGQFQPKRLLTIYDGPTYADGNAFLNVGAWECNAQPCSEAKSVADCKYKVGGEAELPCGIYSGTTQPVGPSGGLNMAVMDTAIGWKQPNGFYYPPAFDYRRSSFLKNRSDALNMCLTLAPGDYKNYVFKAGSCRHEVIDRTQTYLIGNMEDLTTKNPARQSGPLNQLDASTIDFATILLDLDGSLTGSTSTIDGRANPGLTTSVSRNHFFDAPSQSPECLAYGVQTSPYTYISTVMGELRDPPKTASNAILRGDGLWGGQASIAIYRQWKLKEDDEREKTEPCGQVCNGSQYGCPRASFMGMANLFQPSYLTMTQPPGLSSAQTGGLYYIDTNSGNQATSCSPKGNFTPAKFSQNKSYVLYNLFPQRDSKTTYQLYVGDVSDLADIEFRFVRVSVHETDKTNAVLQKVFDPCDPRQPGLWCSNMPVPKPQKGVLTVTIDHKKLLKDEAFTAAARPDYDRCMPRDLCYFDADAKKCKLCKPGTAGCLRPDDFLPVDVKSMNTPDNHRRAPLDAVCEEWSSMVSGQIQINNGASVTSSDCPAGGCVGFAFKLPPGFAPQFYQTVNAGQGGLPLSRCFVESVWMKDVLNQTSNDPQCGTPRPQSSSDFCSDPKVDLPDAKDTTLDEANPAANFGESPTLMVAGAGTDEDTATAAEADAAADAPSERQHTLVGFDAGAIESFLASRPLTRATLELRLKAPVAGDGVLVDATPLEEDFAEGDPDDPESGADLSAASRASSAGVSRTSGLIPVGGRERLPIIRRPTPPTSPGGPDGDVPGATWVCSVDPDTDNAFAQDCSVAWSTLGGDHDHPTTQPALAQGAEGAAVDWDVTADVMAGVSSWLLLLHDEASPTEVSFYSEEGAVEIGDPDLGPVLVLE